MFSIGFITMAFLMATPIMWAVVAIFMWRKGRQYVTGSLGLPQGDVILLYKNIQSRIVNSQMVEAFLEAAPQLLLQLYIIFSGQWEGVTWKFGLQLFRAVSSLLALSWTVTCDNCTYYLFTHLCFKNFVEKVITLLWKLFEISPRFLVLGLFTSVYQWRILMVFYLHIVFELFSKMVDICTNLSKNKYGWIFDCFLEATFSFFGCFSDFALFTERESYRKCCPCRNLLGLAENIILAYLWFHKFSLSHCSVASFSNNTDTKSTWINKTNFVNTTVQLNDIEEAVSGVSPVSCWMGKVALVLVFVFFLVATICRAVLLGHYVRHKSDGVVPSQRFPSEETLKMVLAAAKEPDAD